MGLSFWAPRRRGHAGIGGSGRGVGPGL